MPESAFVGLDGTNQWQLIKFIRPSPTERSLPDFFDQRGRRADGANLQSTDCVCILREQLADFTGGKSRSAWRFGMARGRPASRPGLFFGVGGIAASLFAVGGEFGPCTAVSPSARGKGPPRGTTPRRFQVSRGDWAVAAIISLSAENG